MSQFKYKRISRGGKYYNAMFKDGKFFHLEKWDKEHRKEGFTERSKIKAQFKKYQKDEVQQHLKATKEEYARLSKALRDRVKMNWGNIRSGQKLKKALDQAELQGETTYKRQQAVKKMFGIEFKQVKKRLNMEFYKIKQNKKIVRYRDPKTGRFVKG